MKDILMIVHTMGNLLPSDNDRFTYLAKQMLEAGASVEIVTSDFEHYKKCYRETGITELHPFKITFLHEDFYNKNISFERIKGHASFAVRLKRYLKKRKRPDVIYCAVPPILSSSIAAEYAKKKKIRFVIDVQDLWPETFALALGNGIAAHMLLKPLDFTVNKVYKSADAIIAVSNTYVKRAANVNKKAKIKESVLLGTDGKIVDKIINAFHEDETNKEFTVGYVGNLGKSYDFLNMFKALSLLKERGINDMKFMLIGDGGERQRIEELSKQYFDNIEITGYLPYEKMFTELLKCDVAINPIVKASASSVVNKVGDYAAAGKAVINTQRSNEYRFMVGKYNIGFNTIPENPESIAESILTLYNDRFLCKEMGRNNRKVFEKFFDRSRTYRKIIDAILT